MYKLKLPRCSSESLRRLTRECALTLSLVGVLALSAGALDMPASAEEPKEVPAPLSELLFKAITVNNINAVRIIVEAGADLSRVNMNGQTAMDIAINRNHFDIAQYLVFARRIEQQKVTLAPVTIVRQSAPESAPIIKEEPPQPIAAPLTHQPAVIEQAVKKPALNKIQDDSKDHKKPDSYQAATVLPSVLPSVLPDIEPRQSFFMPQPRRKPLPQASPSLQIAKSAKRVSVARQAARPSPHLPKPSPRQISADTAPKSAQIQPTRRISPQVLDKLRRRLRTMDRQKQTVSEIQSDVPAKIQAKVQAEDLSERLAAPEPISKEVPNTVQKLLNRISSLFGLLPTSSEKPKTVETKTVAATSPQKLNQTLSEPYSQSLPQNTPVGFDTRSVAPAESATALPKPIARPRTQMPRAVSLPEKKAPSLFKSFKEVLLPDATSQAKIGTSISATATDKAQASSARRLTRSMPLSRLRKPLKNVLLTLGDSVATGQTKLPRGIAEPNACVRKRRGKISFCIVPVDWPRSIEPAFAVNTNLYQGTRAIARYDNGKASHYHGLFVSADYDKIIKFMKQRYGPPTDIWKRMIAPFGKPRQPNPTLVWRSLDSETDKVTILEVRKFDDSRSVFPDTEHGAIRLYNAGGPRVFPIITAHDIMSIDWAARSDHIDGASPALARTIRVQP